MKLKNISDQNINVFGITVEAGEVIELDEKQADIAIKKHPVYLKEEIEPVKVKNVKKKSASSASRSTTKKRRKKPLKKS